MFTGTGLETISSLVERFRRGIQSRRQESPALKQCESLEHLEGSQGSLGSCPSTFCQGSPPHQPQDGAEAHSTQQTLSPHGCPTQCGSSHINTTSFVSSVHICPQMSDHLLLTWFRGGLHIWNLGDHGRLCSAPSCLRAFLQVTVFPPDAWVSGETPRALVVTIRVPAVVHFQATANPKKARLSMEEEFSSFSILLQQC